MDLPINIKEKIDSFFDGYKLNELKKEAFSIMDRYKNESGKSDILIDSILKAKIYVAMRMPATFGSAYDVFKHIFDIYKEDINTVTDLGAGPGSASIALSYLKDIKEIHLLEFDEYMLEVGKEIVDSSDIKDIAKYHKFDITKDDISFKSDLVMSSYLLNELNDVDRKVAIKKMWDATNKMMVIIEPGTPKGYQIIKEVRDHVINEKGYIIAPCSNMDNCPISSGDWCHFYTRISRSKIHRLLKEGESPFEDEKYSYIAFSKSPISPNENIILRHPYIANGYVKLEICDKGEIKTIEVRKKDKELYKRSRKLKAGDTLK